MFCTLQFLGGPDRSAGTPITWGEWENYASTIPFQKIETWDVGTLEKTDLALTQDKNQPFPFAYSIDVEIEMEESGKWFNLSQGSRVWVQGFEASGAMGMGFILDRLNIPRGARLYVFNEDRTDVAGPYTFEDNNLSTVLSIPPVEGDRIIFEFYEPREALGHGSLRVKTTSYVYKEINSEERAISDLHGCHVNSHCGDIRPWDVSKNGVVRITVDNGTKWCSGVLLNSTAHKNIPYVLTTTDALIDHPSMWTFRFGFESDDCDKFNASANNSISGGSIVAVDEATGLVLVELNEKPDAKWDIYYCGWDRSGKIPEEAACLHHPNGDIMKGAVTSSDLIVNSVQNNTPGWWIDRWSVGTTEQGSVGAPIFSGNGQVVGILKNGSSDCYSQGGDHVVKLHDAWDTFKDFLDPSNSGDSDISGHKPIGRPDDERIIYDEVAFYPNPASEQVFIYNESDEVVTQIVVYNMNGQLAHLPYSDGSQFSVQELSAGLYIVEIQLESFVIRERLIVR